MAASTEPIIEFKGIKKAFGQKVIYSGLNLQVLRGEVLTICGGSGVGKSVMLKMLIGLLHADAGTIVFDGADVTRMEEEQLSQVRRRIAMLFQSGALFDSLTVGENVGLRPGRALPGQDERRGARGPRLLGAQLGGLAGHRAAAALRISRVACASASAWRARSRCSPKCCCTTSPRPASIRSTPRA